MNFKRQKIFMDKLSANLPRLISYFTKDQVINMKLWNHQKVNSKMQENFFRKLITNMPLHYAANLLNILLKNNCSFKMILNIRKPWKLYLRLLILDLIIDHTIFKLSRRKFLLNVRSLKKFKSYLKIFLYNNKKLIYLLKNMRLNSKKVLL